MPQEKNKRRKLLTISDAISASTGLARIHRDLALRIHENLSDVYDLATFGFGSPGSTKIPIPQLVAEGMDNWVMPTLPQVCDDFFGEEKGIILTILDPWRLTWLAAPRGCSELFGKHPGLQAWALKCPFELWGYIPVDSSGPQDHLSFPLMKTLLGFDRLLGYTQFAEDVIRRTIGDEESEKRHLFHLPHGIDSSTFYEFPQKLSRRLFLQHTGAQSLFHMLQMADHTEPVTDEEILIGCVATNQSRKDLALMAETIAILARDKPIRFWLHTDGLEKYWSIPNLLIDFGIVDKTLISTGMISDNRMASAYSACNVTLAPGLGEGMGFPVFESLFCGTPCIHGDYGGAPEWMAERCQGQRMQNEDEPLLVKPIAYRYEGSYCSKRPVFSAQDWADKVNGVIGHRMNHPGELDWNNLWPRWEAWFREAIA
jgi:glycosyltransferase involved in cell wall biosynthesis